MPKLNLFTAYSPSRPFEPKWPSTAGICFRARRIGNGQNGDGRRGSEGLKRDEVRRRRCSAREISWGRMWSRRDSRVQAFFASMMTRSALPSIFRQRLFALASSRRGPRKRTAHEEFSDSSAAAHSSVALSETTALPALYEFEEARHLCRTHR